MRNDAQPRWCSICACLWCKCVLTRGCASRRAQAESEPDKRTCDGGRLEAEERHQPAQLLAAPRHGEKRAAAAAGWIAAAARCACAAAGGLVGARRARGATGRVMKQEKKQGWNSLQPMELLQSITLLAMRKKRQVAATVQARGRSPKRSSRCQSTGEAQTQRIAASQGRAGEW